MAHTNGTAIILRLKEYNLQQERNTYYEKR